MLKRAGFLKNYILVLLVFLITACEKVDVPADAAACIKKKVRKGQRKDPNNSGGNIWQYQYRGQTVYYIPSWGCCDQTNNLYDKNCNFICAPDGGFSGGGDGKCPDFFATRTDEKLIW